MQKTINYSDYAGTRARAMTAITGKRNNITTNSSFNEALNAVAEQLLSIGTSAGLTKNDPVRAPGAQAVYDDSFSPQPTIYELFQSTQTCGVFLYLCRRQFGPEHV